MFMELKRGLALGAKYGVKGLGMYHDASVETPAVDESAVEGPVGIVVTIAAVVIALYITAIVVGSMSKTTSGLSLTSAWNTTISSLDTQAQSSFALSGILPIAIVGVGILTIIIGAFAMR
jgi:hypothetical protein